MSHSEREHERVHPTDDVVQRAADAAPARATRSSQLTAPETPIASGLVQRKARDANGFAADADAAVASASTSSGAALPAMLMRKFEASLGADLSGVRVHTGAASASAAEAVGAKAYTLGQDIHFAAGHYDPGSPGGEHLLAHEVAHTVQQAGGVASGRQNKLDVSAPGDHLELDADRAADAMVRGTPASVAGASGLARQVMRDKDPDPFPGAPPPTDFDATKIPPNVIAAIDTLTVDALRTLATGAVNHAYANFLSACQEAKAKLKVAQDKRIEGEKAMVEILIGAAGFALGLTAVPGLIGAAASGSAIQDTVVGKVSATLEKTLLQQGINDAQTRDALTAPVIKRLTSERLTALMAKVTPEKASGFIGSAAAKAAGVMAKVDARGSREEKAMSYVDAVASSADRSSAALLGSVGACTDPASLLGAYHHFSAATLDIYRAELEAKAFHFADQIAGTIGENKKDSFVTIDAYGRERLASVHYMESSATYQFISWITPDMEGTVRLLDSNPRKISATAIAGHLPEPTKEGAVYGQELVMRVDAWGRERLLTAKADKGFVSSDWGELHFLGWVSQEGEPAARVKGTSQIGGIPTVQVSQVKGITKPEDPADKR